MSHPRRRRPGGTNRSGCRRNYGAKKSLRNPLRSVSEKLKAEKEAWAGYDRKWRTCWRKKMGCRQSFPRSPLICAGFCGRNMRRFPCTTRRLGSCPAGHRFSVRDGAWFRNQRAARPRRQSPAAGTPLIFSKDEMKALDSKVTKHFLTEGLQSLCLRPVDPAQGSFRGSGAGQHAGGTRSTPTT